MNLSELFIRRPVMTMLLNAPSSSPASSPGRIPVAALPSYNTPVINVWRSCRREPRDDGARSRRRSRSSSRPSPASR